VQPALFRLPATPASTELVAKYFPAMLGLAQGLLDDHAAACCRIPEA
jgi:hypothetical protein